MRNTEPRSSLTAQRTRTFTLIRLGTLASFFSMPFYNFSRLFSLKSFTPFIHKVLLQKDLHKSEKKMQEKMKMTRRKDENLVQAQQVNNNVMLLIFA